MSIWYLQSMTPQEKARQLRPFIIKAAASLDDKDASEAVELYDKYPNDGSVLIQNGTRINWNGDLYRAAVDLWASEQNNPDNAPTLWEKVMYRKGIRVIPEVITAGLSFSQGERGWWGNDLYESLYDNNVNNPERWPQGWTLIS